MKRRYVRIGALAAVGFLGLYAEGCGARDSDSSGVSSALGSSNVVISQVYGGGGNSGAPVSGDFIELFNRSSAAVSLSGWSVQYASASGSGWLLTNLSGTIQPGRYYLVKESTGSTGSALPAADATGTTNLSATAGKVALVNNQTALGCTTSCVPNSAIVDFVGYSSTASSSEGSGPAPAPSNTKSILRAGSGCTDTDDNAADFSAGTVAARNSSSPANACGNPPPPPDAGSGTDAGGGTDAGSGGHDAGGGTIVLPSPTLAPVSLGALTFGIAGDTRPSSTTTGHYPSTTNAIIRSVFSGLQSQNVPFVVASGDYAFSSTGAGSAVPQYNDYMSARALYSGKYLPTMGNHECNGFTDSNCPVGSFTGMTQDYINTIVKPSTGQSNPYFSALYTASNGSWSAKFIFIAANAWDTTQNSWLKATLAVPTTYT
ncbi:MAG TPA: lamin tail domain-containing protein, partial [Polyangiaceae bacterium]|nr:lamin tail domain-containing protein [Polyangiaceae bacterium]